MYSLSGYGHMIADRVRYEAYTRALQKTVRPGAVVLEIGTGPGVFAVEACRLGASRVYAVEPDPVIQVGREIAQANGCADKIEFIEKISTRIDLPIKADVIVSDLRGVLPLFQAHLPSIIDARRRFLAPGGVMIPKRDAIWVSIVEAPKEYAGIVDAWKASDFDLSPALSLVLNDCQKMRATPEQLLAPPMLWSNLDYQTVESTDLHGTLDFSIEREGIGHGLIAWFDACLVNGIGFSNAPGKPEAIYGSMFFPWSEPVSLIAGRQVQVDLRANLAKNDYVWTWNTQIRGANGHNEKTFQQSQLKAAIISKQKLEKSASDYVPQISEDGVVNRRALELMDGQKNLEEISRQLAGEFPGRFARWQQALSWVSQLSDKNY